MKTKLPLKTVRTIVWILTGVGLLIAAPELSKGYTVSVVIGLGIMVLAIVFHFLFYRCPHCGRYLSRNTGNYCQYCHKQLNK